MKEWNENNQFEDGSKNFDLPGGYFQRSAASIFNKIEWQEEHSDYLQLLGLKNANGFRVPENFFLENGNKLELMEYPGLLALKGKNGFTVPENYFKEKEAGLILNLLSGDTEPFKTLDSISKQNPFVVPENYFELSREFISEQLKPKRAKVVHLFYRRLGYSIAAMLLLALGTWIYNFYFTPLPVQDCGTIACLDKTDLVKTKTLERLDDDELYDLVDPGVLEQKIQNTEGSQTNLENKDTSFSGVSVEDILDGI